MIGDKRSGCRGIDPEGFPGQALEKRREVKSPVSDRKPKTVHDLRGSGVTDGNLIQRSDLAVSVDVVELDVPAAVFPKILARRFQRLFVIDEQQFGYVTPLLA